MLIHCLLLLCANMIKVFSISNSVIDISELESSINLAYVSKSHIAAVIHKATEGLTHKDPYFNSRKSWAKKLNLLFGAYHVAQPGNPVEQAEYFLKTVGRTSDILLVLDLDRNPRGSIMFPAEAEKFVKRIKRKTGRYPVLYGTSQFLRNYRKYHLKKCSLWVTSKTASKYPRMASRNTSWVLWQYTDGKVGGAPRAVKGIGTCSRDRYNGSVKQLRERWPYL